MRNILLTVLCLSLSLAAFGQDNKRSGEINYRANQSLQSYISDTLMYVSPVFADGLVFFRDGKSSPAKLNISTVTHEVLFIDQAGDTLKLADQQNVMSVTISGKSYTNTKYGYAQIISFGLGNSFGIVKKMIIEKQQAMTSYGRIPASSTAKNVTALTDINGTNNSSNVGKYLDVKYELQIMPVIINAQKSYLANRKGFSKAFSKQKSDLERLSSEMETDFNDVQDVFDLFNAMTGKK